MAAVRLNARDRQYVQLSASARGFVLAALLAPVMWSQDLPALIALVAIGLVWVLAQVAESRPQLSSSLTATVEATLVGLICGLSLETSTAVLGALAVAPFTSGLHRGLRGVLITLAAQLTAVVAVGLLRFGQLSADDGLELFSWTVTGLGLGLVAAYLHATLLRAADPLAPYRSAQDLLRQLLALSGGLSSGLDPVALGGDVLTEVRDRLPATGLALFVPRGDELTPLVTRFADEPGDLDACESIALEAWRSGLPTVDVRRFAFPVVSEGDVTAVVAGLVSDGVEPEQIGLGQRITDLGASLDAPALRLETALLFSALRDAATDDERQRLARELHDGVAQDIASLGYLVDVLAATPSSTTQATQIGALRDRITSVVGEVRRSVMTLRTTVGANESLGAAIGTIARNLGDASGIAIQVTLDERSPRLRPEVESELFRIAQEAMNNAVRHAAASAIDVTCVVHAPDAQVRVSDDGRGMQPGRSDSHGLQIMRERARLIGADLTIEDGLGSGTVVTVRLVGEWTDE